MKVVGDSRINFTAKHMNMLLGHVKKGKPGYIIVMLS